MNKLKDIKNSSNDILCNDCSVKAYWKKSMKSCRIGTEQTFKPLNSVMWKHVIRRVLHNKHQLSQNNHKGNKKMNTKAGKPKPSAHWKMPWIQNSLCITKYLKTSLSLHWTEVGKECRNNNILVIKFSNHDDINIQALHKKLLHKRHWRLRLKKKKKKSKSSSNQLFKITHYHDWIKFFNVNLH